MKNLFKFKWLLLSIILSIASINTAWADQNINAAYLKASFNGSAVKWDGSNEEYTYSGSGHSNYDLGTLTGDFIITYVSWRAYANWAQTTDFYLYYNTDGNGSSFPNNIKQNWVTYSSPGDYYPKTTDLSHKVASVTDGSGNYDFEHYFYANFGNAGGGNISYLSNGGSNYHFTYTINPPAVASSSIEISATNTAPGSGTGLSSGSPIILISGFSSTLTVTATKDHTDANSELWCKFGTGSYSSTTTYNIASGTTQTNQTLALAVKYRNDDASLDGAETTTTIYYKWAAPAPAITMTSVTPSSSIVAGNDITLVGTRANSSNTISFQYTTNDGSTWTDITPKSSSLSSNVLTATWTVPDAHGATQTFKFRAKLAEATPIYSSKSSGVTVYNTKTIKVKNTNNWATFKSYVYDYSAGATTAKRENWPGSTTGITSAGGQWKQVVLTSQYTYFILNDGSSNQLKGETYTYASSITDGGSYAISSGSGSSLTFSTTSAPTAPTSVTTTAAPTSSTNAKMTVAGSIGTNGNDNITDYGFYYGTTATPGTKAQVGTSNKTGTISKEISSLTAGTTYYFKAYATNGFGTSYGDVKSYKLPYKVTVSTNTGCTSITNSGTNYTNSTITVTATKTTGYTFSSWTTTNGTQTSTSSEGNTNTLVFTPTSDNATIRPTYTENMATVTLASSGHGHVEIGGATVTETTAGVTTTRTITAVPDAGYYFAGWTVSDGADCNVASTAGRDDNESSSTTLSGLGAGTTGTVTANFVENEKIYFRDVFDDGSTVTHWGDVYVYFGIRWDNGEVYTHATNDSWRVHMTKILGTDVWWAYVPRSFTQTAAPTGKQVAFSKDNQNGRNYGFYNTKAASRGDYNKALNMFVPYHVRKSNKNSVDYFDNGYWMKYDTKASQGAGYYLKKYNSTNNYTQEGEFIATNDDATYIQFKLRIDAANSTRGYMITSAGGLNYVADAAITAANCTNVGVSENTNSLETTDVKFSLTTTSEGVYTFVLNQTGDKMKLDVIYPVSEGDYILENSYTGKKKSNPAVDSTYITHSNVIKAADAATKTRYSMFLSNAGTATLKLRKCTGISAGQPTWSDGDATSVSSIMTAVGSTPGVYQFDLAISTSTDKASEIDSVRLYTGNFYIKTDAASGGWVTYTQNIMDKNTVNFDRTAATFDNYWCNYFESKNWNIKCVIANDYCNQLSDTMKADGIARIVDHEPFVPIDGTSIRFSYNSATNTIGRAYLGASIYDDYLDIIPYEADYIFNSSSDDLYDYVYPTKVPGQLRFSDNGDYVYEIDLKVIPGGRAGVTATYNTSSVQDLIPSSNTVLGGSGETPYDVRVVYDFKTNYMMSAFVLPAEDEIADDLEDVDMLWVRHKDESATQVRFDGGSLSNVRVIGAIEFKYNEMCSSAASPVNLSEWNETSRPYLKYFVSFPFDVEMNSIFGLNKAYYGMDYVIQKYNGTKRAKEGLFAGDDDNYWENVQMGDTLFANEGYCVILDNDYARWSGSSDMWYNKSAGSSVFLYFPAMTRITSITNENCSTTVASHECKVNRTWQGSTKNHMQTDSHWNMIGSPLFHDAYIKDTIGGADSYFLSSFYYLNYADNKWYAKATKLEPMFKAMSSRLVQWCGTIGWTTNSAHSAYKAPSRTSEQEKNYLVNLELAYNGKVSDWTYVQLQDGADDDFILREDMYKMYNKGIPQIYTYAGAYDVAYNGVPVKNQTIPVGVVIRKNGTYTFSMPTNFSGTVTLIDTFAQTRTNLAFEDYEVNLQKGTIDDRFLLEIDINNAATAIDGAENGEGSLKDGKAHKFIQNGMMYILRDGVIYDAQGKKVE